MRDEDHNKKAQELLKEAAIDTTLPLPWRFEWYKSSVPMILDANGNVVAVISTGSLYGSYDIEEIIANAKLLLRGSNVDIA